MWPDSRFRELVGVDLPLIQAPMAGASSLEMAIAVSRAGGLGSLAAALLDAVELRAQLTTMRAASAGPINVNFFAHTPPASQPKKHRSWLRQLARYSVELGTAPAPSAGRGSLQPFGIQQCAIIEELTPEVVSFHFGLPAEKLVSRIRAAGVRVLSSATTVEEARWLEELGPLDDRVPDFPLGFAAMAPLRAAAEAQARRDFSAHYCGQSASLCRSTSAHELVRGLAADAMQRLEWLGDRG